MEGCRLVGELKVLIVDPSEDTSEVLRVVLEHHGCRTVVAANFRQSSQLLQVFRPDVVILDEEVDRSTCQGTECTFVSSALKSGAKILVLGGLRSAKGFSSGTVAHLQKPYHYQQLLGKINQIMELAVA